MHNDNINKCYGTKAAYKRIPTDPKFFWYDVKNRTAYTKGPNNKPLINTTQAVCAIMNSDIFSPFLPPLQIQTFGAGIKCPINSAKDMAFK